MVKRALLIALGVACVSSALVAAAGASRATRVSTASVAASPSGVSCANPIQIGMLGPFTGPVASIGDDQLHWAEFFASQWNASHALKINIVQGDTQLNPAIASTVAQSFASNSSIVGVIGPAGSQEVIAVAPILKKAGLAFISGSATKVSLTSGQWAGYFFRVVPNDNYQGSIDSAYMMSHLGVSKGSSVMIVNDEEAYSTGIASIVSAKLKAAGVDVDNESVSQTDTDFSSLVAKVTSSTKVVFLPFQVASEAQLLAQQLKAQGKTAVVFGTDGTFDASSFNVPGSYVSFFAPDVDQLSSDGALLKLFNKSYPGGTTPFGAPNYVAAEVYATAAVKACAAGKGTLTRAALRAAVAKVKLSTTILAEPMAFTADGDVLGGKDFIFQIQPNKTYKQIS
jgi:branched-chain amino acid transport system substrate-binding protein